MGPGYYMSIPGNEQIVSEIVSEISKHLDTNYVYNLNDPLCWLPIHSPNKSLTDPFTVLAHIYVCHGDLLK